MQKDYIKDGKVKAFTITDGKVLTTIKKGNAWVMNPTLTDFLLDGWLEYTPPVPEVHEVTPYIPTKSELIEQYIREHGYPTYGAEIAVINNYAIDAETYAEEYNAYMQVRQYAKQYAENYLNPPVVEETTTEEITEKPLEEEVQNEQSAD